MIRIIGGTSAATQLIGGGVLQIERLFLRRFQVERLPHMRPGQRFDVQHNLSFLKDANSAGRLTDNYRHGLRLAADGGGRPVAAAKLETVRGAEAVGGMQPIARESRLDLRQVRVSGV